MTKTNDESRMKPQTKTDNRTTEGFEEPLRDDKAVTPKTRCVPQSDAVSSLLSDNVGIFIREDGRRGLKALVDFQAGERIFREMPYLWFNGQEDTFGIGLSWGMTRNIALKFPEALPYMLETLQFKISFKPKLTTKDKKVLAILTRESGLPQQTIRKIYNLVCTYNVVSQLRAVHGGVALVGERISIAVGVGLANHSCAPNSERLQTSSIEEFKSRIDGLQALRDISAGEEITWSYFYNETPTDLQARQKSLKKNFGFYCTCERCLEDARQG